MQSCFANSWVKEGIHHHSLPPRFWWGPWHLWPVFVKWVRTRVHRGSVITSLHCRVTWMDRLHWHHIFVTLFRAHCVYAGFGSPSAPGGNAASSKKPVCRLLEKAFEEGWAGSTDKHQLRVLHHHTDGVWPSTSCSKPKWATWSSWSCGRRLLLHQLWRKAGRGVPGAGQPWQTHLPTTEGTGGCILPTLDFSPHYMCMGVHVDKGRKRHSNSREKGRIVFSPYMNPYPAVFGCDSPGHRV